MNETQVIKAVFYNWRPVVGHKRLQLIFEVPIEETAEVLTMLGAPMPDKETWCAIARLTDSAVCAKNAQTEPADKERRAFFDLPMSQQAAIKSNDLKFQLWMSDRHTDGSEPDCAAAIRRYCGVLSRKEILRGTSAGERWRALLDEFEGVR